MLRAIETWLGSIPNTIDAVSTLATVAATAVALWAAFAAQSMAKPRMVIRVTTQKFAGLGGKLALLSAQPEDADVLSVVFKNRSPFPIKIDAHSLWVQFPLRQTAAYIPAFPEPFKSGARTIDPFSDLSLPWAPADEFFASTKLAIQREPLWSRHLWRFATAVKGGAQIKLQVHRSVYSALPLTWLAVGKYGRNDKRTLDDLSRSKSEHEKAK